MEALRGKTAEKRAHCYSICAGFESGLVPDFAVGFGWRTHQELNLKPSDP
jgi:hypothetical protein